MSKLLGGVYPDFWVLYTVPLAGWEKGINLFLLDHDWYFTWFYEFNITPLIWFYNVSVKVINGWGVSRRLFCILKHSWLFWLLNFFLFLIFYHVFNKFIWIYFYWWIFLKVPFRSKWFIRKILVLSILYIFRYYGNFFSLVGLCKVNIPVTF